MIRCSIVCLTLLAGLTVPALAQNAPMRIRGSIESLDGQMLRLKTREGNQVAVRLNDNYSVVAVVPADAGGIAPGAFVGAASMPQPDGTHQALEVLILPEAARGSNEGHYAWDLAPGSMMTNATVIEVAGAAPSRKVTLRYKGGEQTIEVPAGVPVVTFEPGDKAMLTTGAHVMVVATRQQDGSMTAPRVLVGKNGLVPPM